MRTYLVMDTSDVTGGVTLFFQVDAMPPQPIADYSDSLSARMRNPLPWREPTEEDEASPDVLYIAELEE